MKADVPTDLSARMANALEGSGALWSNVLSNVVIDLCGKQEVITNTQVFAELRRLADDEGANRLVRDGAAEALKRLSGKPKAV